MTSLPITEPTREAQGQPTACQAPVSCLGWGECSLATGHQSWGPESDRWGMTWGLPPTSCGILNKSLGLSGPWFLHL